MGICNPVQELYSEKVENSLKPKRDRVFDVMDTVIVRYNEYLKSFFVASNKDNVTRSWWLYKPF